MFGTQSLKQSDRIVGRVAADVPCLDAQQVLRAGPEERAALVADIRNACRHYGFFYLSNWADAIGYGVLTQMQDFFERPDDDPVKQAVARNNSELGWRPQFSEPAYQPGTRAHMESFDVGLEMVDGSGYQDAWPELNGFRNAVSDCWSQFSALGMSTLSLLSEAVFNDPAFLPRNCGDHSLNTLRLLHYPANDKPACDRNVGISAHTDFECMTFILQTAPCLELAGGQQDWLDAPAHDGRLVVMLGDMLERWTNGQQKATAHRVRNTPEQRFSVVMFFAVDPDVEVTPLDDFVSVETPAAYPPIYQEAHMDAEIAQAKANARTSQATP